MARRDAPEFRTPRSRRPILRVFPEDDLAFEHEVEATLDEAGRYTTEAALIEHMTERLRRTYRRIEIHPQHALGRAVVDPRHVWYVLRDGRVTAQRTPGLEGLYRVMTQSRKVERETNAVMERSRRAAAAAGNRAGETAEPTAAKGIPISPGIVPVHVERPRAKVP